MSKHKDVHRVAIQFGIIGLGRFGFALAQSLAQSGSEVMVLDNSENKIRRIQSKVSHALVVEELDKISLSEAGIQNCGTVIVCIGEDLEASVLATLNVIELGIPRVIAKAISTEHGRILQRIGAEVVYPERDRALHLANMLTSSKILDSIELSEEYAISEIKLSNIFSGQSLIDIDFRKKYLLNIIAIVKNGETIVEINPHITLNENDLIVVCGKKDSISNFQRILSDDN